MYDIKRRTLFYVSKQVCIKSILTIKWWHFLMFYEFLVYNVLTKFTEENNSVDTVI